MRVGLVGAGAIARRHIDMLAGARGVDIAGGGGCVRRLGVDVRPAGARRRIRVLSSRKPCPAGPGGAPDDAVSLIPRFSGGVIGAVNVGWTTEGETAISTGQHVRVPRLDDAL